MRRPFAAAAAALLVQLVLGLAAHTAVDGCLPAPSVVLATLPAAALAGWLPQRLLPRARAAARLAVGQVVFHAAMTLLVPCTGHGSGAAHAHPDPGMPLLLAQAAMPAAHLAVVAVCLLVLHRVEKSAVAAVNRLRAAAGRLAGRFAGPTLAPVVASWRLLAQPCVRHTVQTWVGGLNGTRAPPAAAG